RRCDLMLRHGAQDRSAALRSLVQQGPDPEEDGKRERRDRLYQQGHRLCVWEVIRSLFLTHFAPLHNEEPYSLSSFTLIFSKEPFLALLQTRTMSPSLVAISPGNS